MLTRVLEDIPDYDFRLTHHLSQVGAMADLLSLKADLIFLDHHLSATETGLDLLRSLREFGFESAIVMLTGSDDKKLVESFLQCGADAYICKSDLDPGKIAITIDLALRLPHAKVKSPSKFIPIRPDGR